MLEIEQWNLSRNSNGHNVSFECPIRGNNKSRSSNGHNLWLECLIWVHNISRSSKLKNGCSREIQMVTTFHSQVWFRRRIYRDAWNWTTEVSRNSNGHKLSHGGPIQERHISRRWKLNNGSSREIQVVKTFHLEVRFRHIINRDDQNWIMEVLEEFKWS